MDNILASIYYTRYNNFYSKTFFFLSRSCCAPKYENTFFYLYCEAKNKDAKKKWFIKFEMKIELVRRKKKNSSKSFQYTSWVADV